jgi:hypothetical protein
MEDRVVKNMQPPKDDEVQVNLHFSRGPVNYHLINIFTRNQSACIQVKVNLSREEVARFAACIAGLGVI